MSNIPPNIENIVEQMYDKSTPFWIRNNYCITLENIRKYCDIHIAKFQRDAQMKLSKEAKK